LRSETSDWSMLVCVLGGSKSRMKDIPKKFHSQLFAAAKAWARTRTFWLNISEL
jgi:hypothetical protein